MRIRMNDRRDRLYKRLLKSSRQGTKSKALDDAAAFYLAMAGEDVGVQVGALSDLLAAAEQRGSLTGEEIVEILDTDQVPLKYRSEWSVGEE